MDHTLARVIRRGRPDEHNRNQGDDEENHGIHQAIHFIRDSGRCIRFSLYSVASAARARSHAGKSAWCNTSSASGDDGGVASGKGAPTHALGRERRSGESTSRISAPTNDARTLAESQRAVGILCGD